MHPRALDDSLPLAARAGQLLRRIAWLQAVIVLTQSLQISSWFDDGTGLRQLLALPLVVLLGFGSAAALHGAGAAMVDRSLRRRAANAAAVLAADPRPPVLYLRPFDDDLQQARSGSGQRLVPAPYQGLSAEQAIGRVMGGIGPLVAIGRPGEALPPLGFARLYVADDGWQGAVLALLERAAAVVLVAGLSDGLLWELEQVFRHVPRARVLLIVPSWPGHDHAAFCQRVQQRLRITLPPLDPALGGPFPHDIRALISFDVAGAALLHEWDWARLPAAERGRWKRPLFRWFGGRGLPAFAALDALADQHFDGAVAHLLRPRGIAAPDPQAAQRAAGALQRQVRLARTIAGVTAGVVLLALLGLLAASLLA
jgi:hypothetical protein